MLHNKKPYTAVFEDDEIAIKKIKDSESDDSLFSLLDVSEFIICT